MTWLFDTHVHWERWMIYTIMAANFSYMIAYTVAPVCLLYYHMFRGSAFLLPKWLTCYMIFFMLAACLSRLNHIMIFRWPALHYIVIVEAFGGLTSLAAVFVLPYIVKLATSVPSVHRIRNLQHTTELYKKLNQLEADRIRVTGTVILDKLRFNTTPQVYEEIKGIMETLSA